MAEFYGLLDKNRDRREKDLRDIKLIEKWIETMNEKVIMNSKTLPPLSSLAKSIAVDGLYEHYKGFRYKALAVARHSETLEELVVYQALYGEGGVWVRPLAMFLENVTINGQSQPRFKLVQ